MKEETHLVTIPIADYNQLLSAKKLTGLVKLEPSDVLHKIISDGIKQHFKNSPNHLKHFGGDEMYMPNLSDYATEIYYKPKLS